jgi:hypothetical protein
MGLRFVKHFTVKCHFTCTGETTESKVSFSYNLYGKCKVFFILGNGSYRCMFCFSMLLNAPSRV